MLILQLSPNDYVMIGDNIMVKLIKNSKNSFKLAIDAPKEVNIVRGKLYEKELIDEMERNLKDIELNQIDRQKNHIQHNSKKQKNI